MNSFLIATLIITAILSSGVLYYYRNELKIGFITAILLATAHTAVGVVCVKLFAGLESHQSPLNAGMSLFGAVFFLPFFYWVGSKISHRDCSIVFDDFCLCVIIAMLCVRFNCIASGCCMGRIIPGTNLLWPTRQVEIAFWAVLLTWFLYRKKRGYIKGILYPQMMMIYGVFRFLIEFLRNEPAIVGSFHYGHIWSAVSFVAGSTAYFIILEHRLHKKSFR